MAEKKNKKKAVHDWVSIKADYEAGHDVSHIAEKYNIAPSTIYSRIKRESARGDVWGKSLKEKVKSRTSEIMALTYDQEMITPEQIANFSQELKAVEASAIANVLIVQAQRVSIKDALAMVHKYKALVDKILANPVQRVQVKGESIEVDIDIESLGKSLNHYAKAFATVLALQNKAHGLDEKKDQDELEFSYEID